MITATASDPGKYRHGHATVRATREVGSLVLTWIGGGHADPTSAHLDGLIALTLAPGDARISFAVEEVKEAFRRRHPGDLIATAKQEQRIVDHFQRSGVAVHRAEARKWRWALTGSEGPSDEAIEIVVCGLVRGARTAPLARSEKEHAYDAAGLAVYAIAVELGLLTPLGRLVLPDGVAVALAVQLKKDKAAQRAKREAKKNKQPKPPEQQSKRGRPASAPRGL